jgi:uncharacterized membrane protein YdbT with pleckstrin-like domain
MNIKHMLIDILINLTVIIISIQQFKKATDSCRKRFWGLMIIIFPMLLIWSIIIYVGK